MNVIDYAVESTELYKKERNRLVSFIESEIIAPIKEKGFVIETTFNNINVFDNFEYIPEIQYNILLEKPKIFKTPKKIKLSISKLSHCVNGSKYILSGIMNASVFSDLYSGDSSFSESNKSIFKAKLGAIIGEYLKS